MRHIPDLAGAQRIAGAVLAGGASRRMGRDKALLAVDGVPMVERVAGALRGAGCSPVFAVGGDGARLAGHGLDVVADRWPGDGPLGGVLTALAHAGGVPVFVAACDLPWLDEATVRSIVISGGAGGDAGGDDADDVDVVVAVSGRVEPLCALWMPSAARCTAEAFAGGERAVHRVLDSLRVRRVTIDASAVVNVNTPDDLARVEQECKGVQR